MSVLVSIKHVSSGKWISAIPSSSGDSSLAASADFRSAEATFALSRTQTQEGACQLRNVSSGQPVSLDSSGIILVCSPTAGVAATPLQIEPQGNTPISWPLNRAVALKAPNGYVTVGDDGTLHTNAAAVGEAETFELHLPVFENLIVATIASGQSQCVCPDFGGRLYVVQAGEGTTLEAEAVWLLEPDDRGAYAAFHRRTGLVLDGNDKGETYVLARNGDDYHRWYIDTDGDWFMLSQVATGRGLGMQSANSIVTTTRVIPGTVWSHPRGWLLTPHDAVEPTVFSSLNSDGDEGDCPTGVSSRRFAAWMSFIRDDVRLTDLVIPGTHDSGTYNMGLGAVVLGARTQHYNLLGQLLLGMRFLDVRVTRADNGRDLCINHGGVHGGWFTPMLDQLHSFISQMPSEIVILHMSVDGGCEDDTADALSQHLSADTFAVTTSEIADGAMNWSQVTLGDLRRNGRRLIILWEGASGTKPRPWQINKRSVVFDPYNNVWTNILASDIVNELTKATQSRTQGYVATGDSRWVPGESVFFVAQALSTPIASPGVGPEMVEWRAGSTLTAWVNSLQAKDKINIIIRDFVEKNVDSTRRMLWLNAQKGFVYQSAGVRYNALLDPDVDLEYETWVPAGLAANSGSILLKAAQKWQL